MKSIFGPVASRRLGRSLGVDLIPYKTCSFDCLYCELGVTTDRTLERKDYVSPQKILAELKTFLKDISPTPDFITLGGSGEPTLHSHIGSIIEEIKKITPTPIAVLTNSSLLYLDEVREALGKADVILPSLDAATPAVFEELNRPDPTLEITKIIQGLIDFRKEFKGKIWLEILFCLGVNDSPEELIGLKQAVEEINPDKIQLNTLDRPPAENTVFPLTREHLERIKNFFGPRAEIITDVLPEDGRSVIADGKKRVYDLLKRRPCPFDELSLTLGISKNELMDLIETLKKEGKVSERLHNNQVYYQCR